MVVAAVITVPLMTCGLALVMLVMIVMLMVVVTMPLVHRCVLRHGVMLMPLVLRRCRHHSGQHKQCQQQLRHFLLLRIFI